jgi:hypothetical protein
MLPYQVLYDEVLIEEQPFIFQPGKNEAARMMNFRLQQIDMGLRGLTIGAGLPLHIVKPIAVRSYLGTVMGDYAMNKQEHIDYCVKLGLEFTELPTSKRCHVADTVCNAVYLLSKVMGKFELNDNDQLQQPFRATSKRFKKCNARPNTVSS